MIFKESLLFSSGTINFEKTSNVMNYILFDGPSRNNLLPFTFTRPVADIRIGILTLREKWEKLLDTKTSTKTEEYLSGKWSLVLEEKNIFIDTSVIATKEIAEKLKSLKVNEKLVYAGDVIAYFQKGSTDIDLSELKEVHLKEEPLKVENTWDIFSKNGKAINLDFELLTTGRESQPIDPSNFIKSKENIFIEEGALVENSSLNASEGPIYIAKGATIMEGSLIRGPFALCEGATVKLGAKVYGPTTIGPNCKAGGEINNSVLFQNSNKGHDGFLGNSVLGEWCNIGADSNNSNLKNNYADVRIWNYKSENFTKTGLQFCGLIMGDHSKCGINTMFNTGTVVGVSANIFGSGFPRNFIPGFSWGGSGGTSTYKLEKVFETAELVMQRRGVDLTNEDKKILQKVFDYSSKWRRA